MKKHTYKIILPIFILFISCAELQQVVNELPNSGPLSNADIATGLKQALDKGIDEQVTKLAHENGFYQNALVKIGLPDELQQVEKTLRDLGMGNLAEEGIKILNRAAEDAVSEATPIFVNAVKNITFTDAKNILLGSDDAATQYLKSNTSNALYDKFEPVIKNSFAKVGADQIWSNLINKYNTVPFVQKVNPDLTDYVTQEALNGVYAMIAMEEREIRHKVSARTTDVLKRVFALQD